MSLMFDTAINNFYAASIGRQPGTPIKTIALGLQQVSGAIRQRHPNSAAETLLQTANNNFYNASIGQDHADVIATVALGLQQLTAALKIIV
jgi:hypothetical protein